MSAIAVGYNLQERGSTQLSGAWHTVASLVVSQSVSAAIIKISTTLLPLQMLDSRQATSRKKLSLDPLREAFLRVVMHISVL